MADDDVPIPFDRLQTTVEWWPYSKPRSYQLAKDPGDGGPPLATIRVGKRKLFTTRRAMSEFMAARMGATTARKAKKTAP